MRGNAYIMGRSAAHYIVVGNFEKALELVSRAMRQDPFLPDWIREEEAVALYLSNRHDEATKAFKGLTRPSRRALGFWAANQSCLGDASKTEAARKALLRVDPEFGITSFLKSEPPFADPSISGRIARDLTAAGLSN